jgi:hypothetical protein
MNENPSPTPVPSEPAQPGALASLLARLKAGPEHKGKRRSDGCFGKERLKDRLAKQRAADPERVARRQARNEERAKVRAKRSTTPTPTTSP